MSIIDSAKKHPVLLTSVAVGALLLIVLSMSGSSGGTATTDSSGVDQANALASQTQQVNAALQGLSIQAGQAAEHDAASLEALKINAQTTDNANNLAANIASQQITTSAQTTQMTNTLLSQVENNKTQATTDQAAIASNTTIQTTDALVSALITQSNNAAAVGMAAANKKCTSFLGIFSSC